MADHNNSVKLKGRLGKAPVIKQFNSGRILLAFSLATNYSYKKAKSEEVITETTWHNIISWKPSLIEWAKNNLKKGTLVELEGRLTNRQFTNDDNQTNLITEILANEISIVEYSKA